MCKMGSSSTRTDLLLGGRGETGFVSRLRCRGVHMHWKVVEIPIDSVLVLDRFQEVDVVIVTEG